MTRVRSEAPRPAWLAASSAPRRRSCRRRRRGYSRCRRACDRCRRRARRPGCRPARHAALDSDQVVPAVGEQRIAFRLGRRPGLTRDVVHRTAGGVAAEQAVLRAAQHLDALHVEQPERAHVRGVHRHLVHVHAHGRGALPKNSLVPTPRITMCWLRAFCTTTLRFGASCVMSVSSRRRAHSAAAWPCRPASRSAHSDVRRALLRRDDDLFEQRTRRCSALRMCHTVAEQGDRRHGQRRSGCFHTNVVSRSGRFHLQIPPVWQRLRWRMLATDCCCCTSFFRQCSTEFSRALRR